MGMKVECPHCGTKNTLPRDGSVYCKKCSHRADVPKDKCDCLMCALPVGNVANGLPTVPLPDSETELPVAPGDVTELPEIPPAPLEGVTLETDHMGEPFVREQVDGKGVSWMIGTDNGDDPWAILAITTGHFIALFLKLVPYLPPSKVLALEDRLRKVKFTEWPTEEKSPKN